MARALLVITTTAMLLISIHPFAVRKVFFLAVLLSLSSAFSFADPLFMTRQYAPSGDQARSRTPVAPQMKRGQLSLNWGSFERSVALCDDRHPITSLTSFGGQKSKNGSFETAGCGFSERPVCWFSEAVNFGVATPAVASAGSF